MTAVLALVDAPPAFTWMFAALACRAVSSAPTATGLRELHNMPEPAVMVLGLVTNVDGLSRAVSRPNRPHFRNRARRSDWSRRTEIASTNWGQAQMPALAPLGKEPQLLRWRNGPHRQSSVAEAYRSIGGG